MWRGPPRARPRSCSDAPAARAQVATHSPPLPIPYGTHHSKFFLLFYAAGVRVVVHTANLIFCDCNNKTQGLFFQDFPLRAPAAAPAAAPPAAAAQGLTDAAVHADFYSALVTYMRAVRLPGALFAAVEEALSKCDFSSARVALVPSVPGRHPRDAHARFGHMRARSVLAQHAFPARFRRAPLCAQFSSMGSLTQPWLEGEFVQSLSAGRVAGTAPHCALGAPAAPGLSLVWPTVEQVQTSFEGWAAGGSIPGYSHNVSRAFLQPLMSRWGGRLGVRERAMPHIKSYARHAGDELAWVLLGSHNLSRAAWGELQKKGATLFIRSYELSALFLPALELRYRQHAHYGFCCTADAAAPPPAAPAQRADAAGEPARCNALLRCPCSVLPAVGGELEGRVHGSSSAAERCRLEGGAAGGGGGRPSGAACAGADEPCWQAPQGPGAAGVEAAAARAAPVDMPQAGGPGGAGAAAALDGSAAAAREAAKAAGAAPPGATPAGHEGPASARASAGVSQRFVRSPAAATEAVFVAAGAEGGSPLAPPCGDAQLLVVPIPLPYALPPQRYGPMDSLWKCDVDALPGVQDSLGLLQTEAGGTMYGYNQAVVAAYFDENN